mgnify:CR=1 FL=1
MTVTNPTVNHHTGSAPQRGDGLGLTIVHAITERYDARFEFHYPEDGIVQAMITWPT